MEKGYRAHIAIPMKEEDWTEFKQLCKDNGTNITTALTAAFFEVKDYLKNRDGSVFKDFKIGE